MNSMPLASASAAYESIKSCKRISLTSVQTMTDGPFGTSMARLDVHAPHRPGGADEPRLPAGLQLGAHRHFAVHLGDVRPFAADVNPVVVVDAA